MLDASIPLRVKPVEIENPVNAFARVQQIDLMGQQNALAQMAMQERRRAIEDDTALNQAYAGAINETGEIDRPKLFSSMAQNKLGSRIPATQKIFNEQDKSALEATKLKIETTHKIVTGMGSLMGAVTDQRSYDVARAEGARLFGPEAVAHLPAQFDPQDIAQRTKQAMTVAEQLAEQWRKLDYDFKVDEFGYRKTNDEKNRNVTLRGQNMTDARQRENIGVNRERLALERERENAKPGSEQSRAKDAKALSGLLDSAEGLIKDSTGSYAGNVLDTAAQTVGIGTKGAKAIARLKVLESDLILRMPKLSGPQSNLDVQLYRQAAAQIGDPNVPRSVRLEALQTLREINERYKTSYFSSDAAPDAPSGSSVEVNFGELK